MRISDWSSDVCSSDLAAKLIRNLCVAAELENGRRRFSRNRQNRNLKSLQLGRECLDRGGALRLGKHQRIGSGPNDGIQIGIDEADIERVEEHKSGEAALHFLHPGGN